MFETLERAWPYFTRGIQITIQISIIAIILGTVIGLITCFMRMSKYKPVRFIAAAYIWVIRGTPMIVQALMIYFGFPRVLTPIVAFVTAGYIDIVRFTPYVAGVITLSLNAGAYLAEIFRSGIQAVPVGQTEAARSLGLTKWKTMFKIVLPQAFKIILPSLVNQFIISVKDTSILTVIGLKEIVNEAGSYLQGKLDYFNTYVWVAVFYLVIISALMVLSNYIEKRMNNERKG